MGGIGTAVVPVWHIAETDTLLSSLFPFYKSMMPPFPPLKGGEVPKRCVRVFCDNYIYLLFSTMY
jgi:hypothetical protein